MTGEVYFEIKKLVRPEGKGNIPFFVETDKQEIQVLGTHFNVNAYGDENTVRTTLVEGSVNVRCNSGQSVLLKPGQQAVLTGTLEVREADIQQQLAWVNGDFIFRGETLENVLRQVSRWYDVDVECPAHIGQLRFNGMVSRSQPISSIIKMIQSTKKAKVTLNERRFVVTE
ncbi:fec operon regulator FecR [compost metagenome]